MSDFQFRKGINTWNLIELIRRKFDRNEPNLKLNDEHPRLPNSSLLEGAPLERVHFEGLKARVALSKAI